MALEKKIIMSPIKEKLRELNKYTSGKYAALFCYELAGRLGDKASPLDFFQTAKDLFEDLSEGKNRSGMPMQGELASYRFPRVVYDILKKRMPRIVALICPHDFAHEVISLYYDGKHKK